MDFLDAILGLNNPVRAEDQPEVQADGILRLEWTTVKGEQETTSGNFLILTTEGREKISQFRWFGESPKAETFLDELRVAHPEAPVKLGTSRAGDHYVVELAVVKASEFAWSFLRVLAPVLPEPL